MISHARSRSRSGRAGPSLAARLVLVCLAASAATAAAWTTAELDALVDLEWEGPSGLEAGRRCLEAWRGRGGALLDALLPAGSRPAPVRCLLLPTAEFRRRFAGRLPDWGVGVALPGGRLVAVDVQRQPAVGRSLEEVFLHEMSHAVTMQAVGSAWLPTWFQEGVAMSLSGEWRFVDTVGVVLGGELPPLWKLEGAFPAPSSWADQAYRTSLLAVQELEREHGADVIGRLVSAAADSGDFEPAFAAVTGWTLDDFSDRFAARMQVRFRWLIVLTRWPALFVLLALLFATGAVLKIHRTRRRLVDLDEELP
jgi:hypothetical protein